MAASWVKNFFNLSLEFLDNGQVLSHREEAYCRSYRDYVKLAGLISYSSQERLYAYLRVMMPPLERGNSSQGNYPWQLLDQPLLAEVFLLTKDLGDYEQFIDAFPHIFPNTPNKVKK